MQHFKNQIFLSKPNLTSTQCQLNLNLNWVWEDILHQQHPTDLDSYKSVQTSPFLDNFLRISLTTSSDYLRQLFKDINPPRYNPSFPKTNSICYMSSNWFMTCFSYIFCDQSLKGHFTSSNSVSRGVRTQILYISILPLDIPPNHISIKILI